MFSLRKADELAVELKNRLYLLAIDRLAKESGFVKRAPRKIGPLNFLLGCFLSVLSGHPSLNSQAHHSGLVSNCIISKQAINKRMNPALVKFLELLLAASLVGQIKKSDRLFKPATLSQFNRVLVEDSTHLPLPSWLAAFYPGSENATGHKSATLKIRSTIELLSERFIDFHVSPFTHNDQSASCEIISSLQAADLLIRDLGFFVLKALREIADAKAYFISRLRYGVNLYESLGGTEINLLKKLKRHGFVDLNVYLGAHEQLPCRLVAIPVAPEVAAERRRKYKTNRDLRLNPSKTHLALLGWDIFITNVPPERLTAQQIAETYDLRWRIEIIFKSWKSHFNLAHVPRANVVRVQAHVYAMLLFITIFQVHIFVKLYRENLETYHTQLSLLKVARFFKEHLWMLVLSILNLDMVKEQIFYHCRYDSRTDRRNYAQQILALG
jgi:hypothetical protein